MDKRFLNKVLDQIISETRIDYDRKEIVTPFKPHFLIQFFFLLSTFTLFSRHCKNVYGLNEQEIEYVWKEYKDIIKDKIKNNGL